MPTSSRVFSIVDTVGGYRRTQEAGCRATIAVVVVPQCVEKVCALSSALLFYQLIYGFLVSFIDTTPKG